MKKFKDLTDLETDLWDILLQEKYYAHLDIEPLSRNDKTGLEITYGRMYESPELSFSILKQLSELFGTDEIDVDDYSYSGCESCDYGSDYGHTIQVYNPTKNWPEV
jgi:hypothetical protein